MGTNENETILITHKQSHLTGWESLPYAQDVIRQEIPGQPQLREVNECSKGEQVTLSRITQNAGKLTDLSPEQMHVNNFSW